MCRNKKHYIKDNKLIKLFMVTSSDDNQIFTITNTYNKALDYVDKYLKVEHKDHYKIWCELRNYNIDDDNSWSEYYEKCIYNTNKDTLLIKECGYQFSDILVIMRMFTGCMPVGCDYEDAMEIAYMQAKHSEGDKDGNK